MCAAPDLARTPCACPMPAVRRATVAPSRYDWVKGLVGNFSVDGLRVDTLPYVDASFESTFEKKKNGNLYVGKCL